MVFVNPSRTSSFSLPITHPRQLTKMKAAAILSALTFAVGAAAHGAVTSYVIDGVNYPGYVENIWHAS